MYFMYHNIFNTKFITPRIFNKSIDEISFLSSLLSITFGKSFDKSIDNVTFSTKSDLFKCSQYKTRYKNTGINKKYYLHL
ncbi:MAG: hypothetical protein Gaeavirus23_5 [Gaeavirus sp.]|uniref:Uncharacterized protein n=1 Tax=Gaeavirus sp. TaxID=2487767 RepID=A0A3G4ZZ79_9VIRU|nr:MAG: hypothetical protein Gaeavirus23_5 [Gaeavirus sp.]